MAWESLGGGGWSGGRNQSRPRVLRG
jgi:hypothetical protein